MSGRRELFAGLAGERWLGRDPNTLKLKAPNLTLASTSMTKEEEGGRTTAMSLRFASPLPAGLALGDLLTSSVAPTSTVISNTTLWGNNGHGARIKAPNVLIDSCLIGFNSYGAIGIPDASHWKSSMCVTNFTLKRSRIYSGDAWAVAQYDKFPASICITAYGKKGIIEDGTPNSKVFILDNLVSQGAGVDTAIIMRATDTYVVSGNRVVFPATTKAPTLIKELNSTNGKVGNNTCMRKTSGAGAGGGAAAAAGAGIDTHWRRTGTIEELCS